MIKNCNLFKNRKKKIFFVFFIFFTVQVCQILYIQYNRQIPVEPDDALVYTGQAYLLYNDFFKKKKTHKELKTNTKNTFNKETDFVKKKIISSIHLRFTENLFFFHSLIFGFFTEFLKIDPFNVWWGFNYFFRFIFSCACFLIAKKYSSNLLSSIGSLVCFLIIPYYFNAFYMATPFVFSICLFFIFYLLYVRQKIKGFFLCLMLILPPLIHPVSLYLILFFSFYHLILFYFYKNKNDFRIFFFIIFIFFFFFFFLLFILYFLKKKK